MPQPHKAPHVAEERAEDEVAGIHKIDVEEARTGFAKLLYEFVVQKATLLPDVFGKRALGR